MPRPKPKTVIPKFRVRCLGPGPEHTFLSEDPVRRRTCTDCQAKIRKITPTLYTPFRMTIET